MIRTVVFPDGKKVKVNAKNDSKAIAKAYAKRMKNGSWKPAGTQATKVCYRIPNRNILSWIRLRLSEDMGIDMYYLEKVFHKEANGHGYGCGGEDISFTFYGQDINICNNGRYLEITNQEDHTQIKPQVVALLERNLCRPGMKLIETTL